MEQLRKRQLLHPELVTEGMNRLAQALIILTDPSSKAVYDAEIGLAIVDANRSVALKKTDSSSVDEKAEPLIVGETVFDDDLPPVVPEPGEGTQELVPPSPVETRISTVEPENESLSRNSLAPSAEASPSRPGELYTFLQPTPPATRRVSLPPVEREEPVVEGVVIASQPLIGPARRRWIYARLALLRRILRVWDRLGVILGDPQDPVDRPGRVVTLLEAVEEVRPLLGALPGLVGGVGEPGGIVAAILRQPLVLDTFRRLLPSQRQAVAIDWRRGRTELQEEYARLRRISRTGREERTGSRRGLALLRYLSATPELTLLLLAGMALFIAFLRMRIGR